VVVLILLLTKLVEVVALVVVRLVAAMELGLAVRQHPAKVTLVHQIYQAPHITAAVVEALVRRVALMVMAVMVQPLLYQALL
jgi:hypothetical protein